MGTMKESYHKQSDALLIELASNVLKYVQCVCVTKVGGKEIPQNSFLP